MLFDSAAGPKILQALGGASIDLSFVNTTAALLALAQGAIPLRLISVPTDPSRLFAVIGKADIGSAPALKGKKVAATEGTALHYFLARVLAKYGMGFSDIQYVNLPAAQGQAAFVAGQVDAVVPSVNGRFYLMSTDKSAREVFTHKDFGASPQPQTFINYDLFVTTEKVVQSSSRRSEEVPDRLSRQGGAVFAECGHKKEGHHKHHGLHQHRAEEPDRSDDHDADYR